MGEHEVDGAPDASGEDAERLALAVTTLEPVQMGLAAGVVPQEEYRGLTEGPLQVGVADLGASSAAGALAVARVLAPDEAAVGAEA
jgi:hypothetical protein